MVNRQVGFTVTVPSAAPRPLSGIICLHDLDRYQNLVFSSAVLKPIYSTQRSTHLFLLTSQMIYLHKTMYFISEIFYLFTVFIIF